MVRWLVTMSKTLCLLVGALLSVPVVGVLAVH
jgi:hypothetical protein